MQAEASFVPWTLSRRALQSGTILRPVRPPRGAIVLCPVGYEYMSASAHGFWPSVLPRSVDALRIDYTGRQFHRRP
jgi:hypothetical protein